MNTTFCMAPWVNVGVFPNGHYSMCCSFIDSTKQSEDVSNLQNQRVVYGTDTEDEFYIGSIHNNSLEEIWNNDKMKNIRIKMLKGEYLKQCEACYYSESIIGSSERTRYSKYFKSHKDKVLATKPDGSVPFTPLEWDLRLTNKCNFKCRDCCSALSSSWEEESKKLNVHVDLPKPDEQKILNELEPLYDSVQEVYFAGGEPLISDHHYHILNKLLEKKKYPCIRYNTNLSTLTYKGNDIINIWKQFPKIELFVSFDGIGKRGELIRNGFDSKKIHKKYSKNTKRITQSQYTL